MTLNEKELNALAILKDISNTIRVDASKHLNNALDNYSKGSAIQKSNALDEMIFIYISATPSDSNFCDQLDILVTEINLILETRKQLPPRPKE